MKKFAYGLVLAMFTFSSAVSISYAQDVSAGKKRFKEVQSRVKTINTSTLKKMIEGLTKN